MNRNIGILFLVLVAVAASVLVAENYPSNYISKDDVVEMTWSVTSPTPGKPVIKCESKATGGIIGVALDGAGTAGEKVQVITRGIVKVQVLASSSLSFGDYLFASVPATTTYVTEISDLNTGLLFGQALAAHTATTTVNATNDTISVKLLQPSHL